MEKPNDFAGRVDRIFQASEERARKRQEAREREMETLGDRLDRFERAARAILRGIVLPRLQLIADRFPNSLPPMLHSRAHCAVLEFETSDEYPASTRLSIHTLLVPDRDQVRLVTEVRIIPVLFAYDDKTVLDVDLDLPDEEQVEAFLDDCLCRFVSDYVRIREPDSPYQQDRRVTDPVCGMTFHRAEAAASVIREGTTYYFCVDACRDKFEMEPGRYV